MMLGTNVFRAAAAAALLVLAGVPQALAKTSRRVSYSYERVWPAAVRFLRVDEGLTIVDSDSEAGYVIFKIEEESKTFRGALELIRRVDGAGRAAVELSLDIRDRPRFMERGLLDGLLQKLRTELGPPPNPPAKAPPKSREEDESLSRE